MSRLEDNSRILRENLISRNEFSENNIYDINISRSTEIVNGISRLLRPGNAFDFSNTVIGRIIGPQTPLTEISSIALRNLYTKQLSTTIVRKNTPTINLSNLFNGELVEIKNIDYSITKENPDNIQDKIINLLSEYSGVNKLKNPIEYTTDGITSNHDKKWIYNTTELSKGLLKEYTGKGQIDQLQLQLSNNIYYNDFNETIDIDNSKLKESIKQNNNLSEYFNRRYTNKEYSINNINSGISYKIDSIQKQDDVEDIVNINNTDNTFTWGISGNSINESINNDIGLLGYTNALFNSLSTDGKPSTINKSIDSIELDGKKYYNGVKYSNRSYSINNQMNSLDKTIRPYGNKYKNSTLENRITPKIIFRGDNESNTNNSMFTIENLAFDSSDKTNLLNNQQYGPNDGRIMWFSPSIINFNESVIPNINSVNFLGRGEPVYTYANTERNLQIDFYMIADYVNEFLGVSTLTEFTNKIYNTQSSQTNNNRNSAQTNRISDNNVLKLENDLINARKRINTQTIILSVENNLPIDFYYRNNNVGMVNFDINQNFNTRLDNLLSKLNEYYSSNDSAKFEVNINGSVFDTDSDLNKIYNIRSTNFKDYIISRINIKYPKLINIININIEPYNDLNSDNVNSSNISLNSEDSNKKRKMTITSVSVSDDLETFETERNDIPSNLNPNIDSEINTLEDFTETDRVNLIQDDEIYDSSINGTFNKIKNQKLQNGLITYTPFDIYERLTFLHQCTRQGRTPVDNEISNAAYGKPPIIVFKLGDMYNTKAILTSLDFSFEEEIPWDLNPEGFGVQKMGCKVSMRMNLIGASGIYTPKSHILNGNSKRFYANSSFESNNDIVDDEDNILNN